MPEDTNQNTTDPNAANNKTDPVGPETDVDKKTFNDEVDEFFEKWDADKDEKISREELKAALLSVWPGTTDQEVDAVLSKLDLNDDGFICKKELKIKKPEKEEKIETPLWLWGAVVGGYVLVGIYVLWDKKCKKGGHDHDHHDHNHDQKHSDDDKFKKVGDNEAQKPTPNPTI